MDGDYLAIDGTAKSPSNLFQKWGNRAKGQSKSLFKIYKFPAKKVLPNKKYQYICIPIEISYKMTVLIRKTSESSSVGRA
jgi:hypothetical protein